eukprot:7388365-Prymnesium_polylepis.2
MKLDHTQSAHVSARHQPRRVRRQLYFAHGGYGRFVRVWGASLQRVCAERAYVAAVRTIKATLEENGAVNREREAAALHCAPYLANGGASLHVYDHNLAPPGHCESGRITRESNAAARGGDVKMKQRVECVKRLRPGGCVPACLFHVLQMALRLLLEGCELAPFLEATRVLLQVDGRLDLLGLNLSHSH